MWGEVQEGMKNLFIGVPQFQASESVTVCSDQGQDDGCCVMSSVKREFHVRICEQILFANLLGPRCVTAGQVWVGTSHDLNAAPD
jgi:hypothetical protein